jgi:rare lipoprotein A
MNNTHLLLACSLSILSGCASQNYSLSSTTANYSYMADNRIDALGTDENYPAAPQDYLYGDKNRSGAPASSAGNPSRYTLGGKQYKILPFSNGFVERGIASWYGPDFHGEKTSNGEIYNMYGMTAAHKRLPIPTYVRVTNLKNKRNVVLRINDRGPYYADRVIDLSYGAAQALGLHQQGTEMVQIEALPTQNEKVYLQLGVFSSYENALALQKKVAKHNLPTPMIKDIQFNGKPAYRVQLGPVFSSQKVDELNSRLAQIGIVETWYIPDNKTEQAQDSSPFKNVVLSK